MAQEKARCTGTKTAQRCGNMPYTSTSGQASTMPWAYAGGGGPPQSEVTFTIGFVLFNSNRAAYFTYANMCIRLRLRVLRGSDGEM